MIKDKLLFSADSSYLYKKCLSCTKNSHTLCKCPMINPLITRTLLIRKNTASKPQNRQTFFRNKIMKYNSRKKLDLTQKSQNTFFVNNVKSEDSLGKLSNNSDGTYEIIEKQKAGKLSVISEKEDEESEEFLSEKEWQKQILNLETKKKNENESEISFKEEKISSLRNPECDSEALYSDYDSMKLFKNYQPHFNYNVIIMLLNNEHFYRVVQMKPKKTKEKQLIMKSKKSSAKKKK